jgi:hypothetical protein
MKIRKLRQYLREIHEDNSDSWTLYFVDQDDDYFTITDIYEDDDGDVCLEADDGCDYSASDIYNSLRKYSGDQYVYIYNPYYDESFEIEGGWYWDDENDLVMDIHYHPNYDDY